MEELLDVVDALLRCVGDLQQAYPLCERAYGRLVLDAYRPPDVLQEKVYGVVELRIEGGH